jgi:hypothetical protein
MVTTTTTRAAPLPRPRLAALSRLAAWPWHRLALGAVLALPCPGSGLAVTGGPAAASRARRRCGSR